MMNRTITAVLLGTCLCATMGCTTETENGSDPSQDQVSGTKDIGTDTDNTLSRADILLVKRMQNASNAEVQEYMRSLVDEEFPADHEIPEYIIRAGNAQAASEAIGKHFPDFFMKKGNDLISQVRKDPLQWRQIILETKALRRYYGKETYLQD